MDKQTRKQVQRARRKVRIRKRVLGTPDCPRLTVYKSLEHVYAQVIDDLAGRTLASASTRDKGFKTDQKTKTAEAKAVGSLVAERAKQAGVRAVVFDRNGFRFHGRVKALADAARESGLKF